MKIEAKLEPLKCGQCGEGKHLLYIRQNGEILVGCIKCGNVSEITIQEPEIIINNVSGNGTLCVFPSI